MSSFKAMNGHQEVCEFAKNSMQVFGCICVSLLHQILKWLYTSKKEKKKDGKGPLLSENSVIVNIEKSRFTMKS